MPIIGLHTADGENLPPQLSQKGGPVKRYDVEVNGFHTTVQLTDADAKARGLLKDEPESKAKTPANKARTPANKAAAPKPKG